MERWNATRGNVGPFPMLPRRGRGRLRVDVSPNALHNRCRFIPLGLNQQPPKHGRLAPVAAPSGYRGGAAVRGSLLSYGAP
jgi:hypothetical protein